MSNLSLQTLTWGTVAAAIASALWLAAGDSDVGDAWPVYGRLDRAALPHAGEHATPSERGARGSRAHLAPRKTTSER